MRELHPSRLGFRQSKLVLKMFIHYVNQAIAEPPQKEKRGHEYECESNVLAFVGNEKALLDGGSGFHEWFNVHLLLYRLIEKRCKFLLYFCSPVV